MTTLVATTGSLIRPCYSRWLTQQKAVVLTISTAHYCSRSFQVSLTQSTDAKNDRYSKTALESSIQNQNQTTTSSASDSRIDAMPTTEKVIWSMDYRKIQLDHLQDKFQNKKIQDNDQLQDTWKEMESRVTRRKPRTMQDKKKTGRNNIKKTDEDVWLQEGLYDNDSGVPSHDSNEK